MTSKPIIFSAPMVRAILDGRKTQTRRVVRDDLAKQSPYGRAGDELWVRETWAQPFKETDYDSGCIFRADGPEYNSLASAKHQWGEHADWKPSIHLKRKHARLFLRITSVRVERLQEISEADAIAEGTGGFFARGIVRYVPLFAELWDSLNAKRAPWSSNPWVWVIGFERVA